MNVERRFTPYHVSLNLLNQAQRSAFDELAQHGYGLLFLRATSEGKVAVCSTGDELALINDSGQITRNPTIEFRK